MKNVRLNFIFIILPLLWTLPGFTQNGYYFAAGETFDTSIPEPRQILSYDVGEFHTRIDLMVKYMELLAASSDKVSIERIGYTNERRPQIVVTITSPENHSNLERIRLEHLKFSDPLTPDPSSADLPSVVLLGYNVHGNEPSSTEAAMLTAYYLTASTSTKTANYLKNAVILIDPAYNPDGRDRHTTWVNTYHGFPIVADPLDIEHNEAWPRGRTNHYWFDLNRDWLPLAQIESRNRMEFYHKWMPNVATDFHEMGSNSTYFFEPTKPFGSENPIVPRSNYDRLNNLFAKYFEEALNEINSLYFTEEQYDNSYPGYGSTYPDIQGGLGLVFEQASSRGHVQTTLTGKIEFPFTIRNHLRTSLATILAAVENKDELMFHQSTFFKDALKDGQGSATKAFVFGDSRDKTKTLKFAELLLRHRIKVYALNSSVSLKGKQFQPGSGFAVPTDQAQYKMVKTMFEPVTSFYDSIFYDASAWTIALGFDIPYEKVSGKPMTFGKALTMADIRPKAETPVRAKYAYFMEWSEYDAPKVLHKLQQSGVIVRASTQEFSAVLNSGQERRFMPGTLVMNLGDQQIPTDMLYSVVTKVSAESGIDVYGTNSGRTIKGPDLGSGSMRVLQKPELLMLVGGSSSSGEAGEVWHLMDQRVGMPISKVDMDQFSRINLNDYTTLILVSGNYSQLGENNIGKIKDWVRSGGTVIGIRSAVSWLISSKLVNETLKTRERLDQGRTDYDQQRAVRGSKAIGGSIYMTDLDTTHPIGFGFTDRDLPVYRNHTIFLNPSKDPYKTIALYKKAPLLDGYVHPDNLKALEGTASAVSSSSGRGRYILFVDNPNFRGYWYGTNRMFFNAVFFGNLVF